MSSLFIFRLAQSLSVLFRSAKKLYVDTFRGMIVLRTPLVFPHTVLGWCLIAIIG